MRTKSWLLLTGVVGLSLASGAAIVSGAVGVNSTKLRNAVTVDGIRAHQQALQDIADIYGTRASGTDGFAASAAYVRGQLEGAGYTVEEQSFDFPFFEETAPAAFDQTSPNIKPYGEPADFATMEYSGSGDVTAHVQPAAGIIIPPDADPSSASGCAATDFDGFGAGNVALVQRGTCTFFQKAFNAQEAGASAVIIFNEGNPGRTDNFGGTLGGLGIHIPVISASFAVGEELYNLVPEGVIVHVSTTTSSEILTTKNLIAETAGGRADRVVAVGAHLDSVPGGAGIQDNGSGSAAILEIALRMKSEGIKPRNKVRFLWFGAEEAGLLGSEYYVSRLTKREIKNIAVNLNFDMIGSPNYVRFVYDGDGSDTGTAGPNGSAVIEDVFAKYFNSQNPPLPFEATAFDGRSDYGPFIDVGIPAGGLFTGAEELKTVEQAEIYGGTVGEALDPCYHATCDDFDNISLEALDQMSDAAADAVMQFAMTTSAVKGTSKANDQAVKSVDSESLAYRGNHLQK